MYGTIPLPDYTQIFELEAEKRHYQIFNRICDVAQINPFSKWLIPKKIKNHNDFLRVLKLIEMKLKSKVRKHKIVTSGYAFACFSNFSSISSLKRTVKSTDLRSLIGWPRSNQQFTFSTFVGEEDIVWYNCSKKKSRPFVNLAWKLLLFFILIFLTTPAVF